MFIHLAVHVAFVGLRRETLIAIKAAARARPQLVSAVLRDALTVPLGKFGTSRLGHGEEEVDKRGRYTAVLLACATVGGDAEGQSTGQLDKAAKETLIVDWLVLAHHPAICAFLFVFYLTPGSDV